MPNPIEILLNLSEKIKKESTANIINILLESGQDEYYSVKRNLHASSQKNGLTAKRVSKLRDALLTPPKAVTKIDGGVRITIGLKEDSDDTINYWATMLNVGGTVVPKEAKMLAIPMDGVKSLIGEGKRESRLIKQIVATKVEKSKAGKPKLHYSKSPGNSLIMSGKIRGAKWEPLAVLLKEVKFPKVAWADKMADKILTTLQKEVR